MKKNTDNNNPQRTLFQVTINNPIKYGWSHNKIIDTIKEKFKNLTYICMSDEQGSCYHTHVLLVFEKRVRFEQIKSCFPEAHIEFCRKTIYENYQYLKKTGIWHENSSKQEQVIPDTFEEFGVQPPDMINQPTSKLPIYQMVKDNMTNAEIFEQYPRYALMADKIDRLRTMLKAEEYKSKIRYDLKVIYVWAPTISMYPKILDEYGGFNVHRVTDYRAPFDTYREQTVIVFDNFYSSLPFHEMITYCDIYPVDLHCRYYNKTACYTTVYIISSWPPEQQYKDVSNKDINTRNSFFHKIHKIVIFHDDESTTEYNSVQEYFNREVT